MKFFEYYKLIFESPSNEMVIFKLTEFWLMNFKPSVAKTG